MTEANIKKGKFVGNCASCGMMIVDFDKIAEGYKCPHCGKLVKEKTDETKGS